MTHTEGPWYLLSGEGDRVHVSNSVGKYWAEAEHYVGEITGIDNAVMVAAAPELLEAVLEAEHYIRLMSGSSGLANRLQQAIAKAERRAAPPKFLDIADALEDEDSWGGLEGR